MLPMRTSRSRSGLRNTPTRSTESGAHLATGYPAASAISRAVGRRRADSGRVYPPSSVIVYAIADLELGDRFNLGQTVGDVELSRSAAEAQLAERLADEPDWAGRLRVVAFDLGSTRLVLSAN